MDSGKTPAAGELPRTEWLTDFVVDCRHGQDARNREFPGDKGQRSGIMEKTDMTALRKAGFIRQRQKEYMTVRLMSVGGRMTTHQLQVIQGAADRFARGIVFLNVRQGMEIPFVPVEKAEALRQVLEEGGVKSAPGAQRVGAPIACKGNQICPAGLIDTTDLAEKIIRRYGDREVAGKFMIGISGCQNNCVRAERNDCGIIGSMITRWQAEGCTYCGICEKKCPAGAIRVDSAAGTLEFDESRCIHCGKCVRFCPEKCWTGTATYDVLLNEGDGVRKIALVPDQGQLFAVLDTVLEFFEKNAEPWERFSRCLKRVGFEKLEEEVEQVLRRQ